jgi:hypothetical protein
LNICTSHRGNSIWGSVRRSVSATVAGNPVWKVLYFSCSKEKAILQNKIRQGNRENILGPFSRLWWNVSSEINCKRKSPSLWPCDDVWSFTSCSEHWHIFLLKLKHFFYEHTHRSQRERGKKIFFFTNSMHHEISTWTCLVSSLSLFD